MNLWNLMRASIYSPSFYRGLSRRPLRFSLIYYFTLGLALAVAFSAIGSLRAIPATQAFLDKAGAGMVRYYPEDLVLTLKNGEVSLNKPEPYILAMPDDIKSQNKAKNLVVVDTRHAFSKDSFAQYDTALLILKNDVAWKENNGAIRIEPLSEVPDMVVDQKFVRDSIAQFQSLGRWLSPIIVFGFFGFFMLNYALELIYLFIGGLFAWLIARTRHMKISYGTGYRMAIHAFTPVTLLGLFVNGGTFQPLPPFLPSTILILVLALNIRPELSAPISAEIKPEPPAEGGSSLPTG